MGACIEPGNVCLVWLYCPKGSLADVLRNENIKVDWMFKLSFISDIARVSLVPSSLTSPGQVDLLCHWHRQGKSISIVDIARVSRSPSSLTSPGSVSFVIDIARVSLLRQGGMDVYTAPHQ